MIKEAFSVLLLSSSGIAITPILINYQDNNNMISKLKNEENNIIVFSIIQSLLYGKTTDGSSLNEGKNINLALPLLWQTLNGFKSEAKKQAELVPIIGSDLVTIIDTIQEQDLSLDQDNTTLVRGTNIIRTILEIDGSKFKMWMILVDVV